MNDEAVSPVVGVIIMVSITVLLAAVIAAFVFGMSGNIQPENPNGYVDCANYYLVQDKYQTPSGFYVKTTEFDDVAMKVPPEVYPKYFVGQYAYRNGYAAYYPINLTHINESVSGLRNTCKVVP